MKLITLINPSLVLADLAVICQPDDAILLRQDAVWLCVRNDIDWPLDNLYALQSDVQLRQLTVKPPVRVIDNTQWVALTIEAQQVLLWQN